MTDEDYSKLYERKNFVGDPYNFDIHEMIRAFSFDDLCSNAPLGEENGAILLITGKQYVLAYNAGWGLGPHGACMARIVQDLAGGGRIDQKSSVRLSVEGDRRINGRILYERGEDPLTHRIYTQGFIHFNLVTPLEFSKGFSKEEYEMFMEFYEDHNEEIKRCSDKYHFVVSFCYRDNEGKLVKNVSSSLDDLKTFIEGHIVEKDLNDANEVILNPPKRRGAM